MNEKVRLVIWDLDETFWYGTLTEGGIRVRPEYCELVRELARRGIISSICSKNNFNDVKEVLERERIWEYFVFPSINWEPKGPRIAALVETVQLRAPTVMFIDDNPMNLEEVRHYVPGIQVQSDKFIPTIFTSPLFIGKDDRQLSRLQQYKLLETRKRDEAAAGQDVSAFLRSSRIKVEFERDLEAHIDRVVELINRTNQLNFTKNRLPENPVEAREAALALISKYNMQSALIRVTDRYGDHGFCGLYIVNSETNVLFHFCFSCRILGMGVEQWLYNALRRPQLVVRGEVLSDPKDTSRTVDWINVPDSGDALANAEALPVTRMVARGGCDLSAVSHYFGLHGLQVVPEFNIIRDKVSLRIDHSIFLHYALYGLTDEQRAVAAKMHYSDQDFRSDIFQISSEPRCILFSFASDGHHAVYRHRKTGFTTPCWLGYGFPFSDQREYSALPNEINEPRGKLLQILKDEFDYCGRIGQAEYQKHLTEVFGSIGRDVSVFVVCPCENHLHKETGKRTPDPHFAALNRWTRAVAEHFPNVILLDMQDFVNDISEMQDILHFSRQVYFRIYERILSELMRPKQKAAPADCLIPAI